jgi:hypothetical protein
MGRKRMKRLWAMWVAATALLCAATQGQTIELCTISILSDAGETYAGNEIILEVKIYDSNGLVPGTYCGETVYQDSVGAKDGQQMPEVTVDNVRHELNIRPDTASKIEECFEGGIDTVRIVLYNAEETHKIWVRVDGVEGKSVEFRVYPGAMSEIRIRNTITNNDTNDLTLHYPDGVVQFTAKGYDEWGNGLGDVNSTWETTGTLHDIGFPFGAEIFYDTEGVTGEEDGMIIATKVGSPVLSDTVNVMVRMPMSVGDGRRLRTAGGLNPRKDHSARYDMRGRKIAKQRNESTLLIIETGEKKVLKRVINKLN